MPRAQATVDPTQIMSPAQIPPAHAQYLGLTPNSVVDIYCGTMAGDIDALPAAKELLGVSMGTGGQSNADYIYDQVSRLYGGAQLPSFQSTSGNTVKSLVFASGSAQGGYGAFHIGNGRQQTDFDKIVVDSLNVSGHYSSGSHLGLVLASPKVNVEHLFPKSFGPGDLLGVTDPKDALFASASPDQIRAAHLIASHNLESLQAALEARDPSVRSPQRASPIEQPTDSDTLANELVSANQDIIGLVHALTSATSVRQYLSTALFAAEIVESFQTLTHKADPGKTDGEAVSRVLAYKLAPEISLVPGFSSVVAQEWWQNGHADYVTNNSESDRSGPGNGCGVMFLLFLTDYLGISLEEILKQMPAKDGAPLGDTYVNLVRARPELSQAAGADGAAAFAHMIQLLTQHAQTPSGLLNLPANGNPFPSMPGAKPGGVFETAQPASPAGPTGPVVPSGGALAQDVQAALGLEAQIEQQLSTLKSALQRIQGDISGTGTPNSLVADRESAATPPEELAALFGYGPPLPSSIVTALDQQVAQFKAPQFDGSLQSKIWPHVYNELPGSGNNTARLQVITGTMQAPESVAVTGTISQVTTLEPDGDLHIHFQPDDPAFPVNHSPTEAPLVIEIIYAGQVTQADAQQAERGYTNPFDISHLTAGTRMQAAGPLIFDRAHGRVDPSGRIQYGLEIHPLAGMTVLSRVPGPGPVPQPGPGPAPHPGPVPQPGPTPAQQLADDIAAARGQATSLSQTMANLSALIQKLQSPG